MQDKAVRFFIKALEQAGAKTSIVSPAKGRVKGWDVVNEAFNENGTYRSTNPAHPRSTFEVEMTYTVRRFRLEAFSVS